jgi:3-phosphoshikimate 1-carboxyvinyltransferase
MLAGMGVDISREVVLQGGGESGNSNIQYVTRLTPPDPLVLKPLEISVPGDFSSAAFLIVAGLVTPGSQVILRNVGLNPTRTGLLDALVDMGGQITIQEQGERGGEPVGDLIVRSSVLQGTHIYGEQVVRMIDEFPVFSIAAAYANGESLVSQAEELRHKESDRISVLCKGLQMLGIHAQERQDGFRIQGGQKPPGGIVDAHGDHRLGMAFALAGLAARRQVIVRGAQVIAESFPGFTQTLSRLGSQLQEEP